MKQSKNPHIMLNYSIQSNSKYQQHNQHQPQPTCLPKTSSLTQHLQLIDTAPPTTASSCSKLSRILNFLIIQLLAQANNSGRRNISREKINRVINIKINFEGGEKHEWTKRELCLENVKKVVIGIFLQDSFWPKAPKAFIWICSKRISQKYTHSFLWCRAVITEKWSECLTHLCYWINVEH